MHWSIPNQPIPADNTNIVAYLKPDGKEIFVEVEDFSGFLDEWFAYQSWSKKPGKAIKWYILSKYHVIPNEEKPIFYYYNSLGIKYPINYG